MPALSPVPQTAADGAHVQLGSYDYEVVPQRIGRLRKRLGRAFADLESLQGDTLTDFISSSLERAHGVLQVFVPDLMPVYEFCGYRSAEAMAVDDDEDEGEWGPTLPDIINAFEVVMRVNRLDLLGHLRSVVSPEIVRAYLSSRIAEAITAGASPTSSSASTPSTNGQASESTSSGTTPPTAESSLA